MKSVNEWKHTAMTIPNVSVKSAQNTSEIQTAPTHFCICKKEEEQNLQWECEDIISTECVCRRRVEGTRGTLTLRISARFCWGEVRLRWLCSAARLSDALNGSSLLYIHTRAPRQDKTPLVFFRLSLFFFSLFSLSSTTKLLKIMFYYPAFIYKLKSFGFRGFWLKPKAETWKLNKI